MSFSGKLIRAVAKLRVAPGGWGFALGFAFAGFCFLFFGRWFSVLVGLGLVTFGAFCLYFFRDAVPNAPEEEGAVVSPSDGTVMEVCAVNGEGYGQGQVVRIFLSVLDAHVQRAPVSGTIRSVVYTQGAFLDARDQRAPFVNEQNAILIDSALGPVMVKQLAGLLARRIRSWVFPGDEVKIGESLGLIRFGSQVDLYVPANVALSVKEGDRVKCAQTVVGQALRGRTSIPPTPGQASHRRA